jgi:dTMP kinase
MNRGKFITVEGTDGSGKTTQYGLIRKYLLEKGYDVVAVRDPGGTEIGEKIRAIILDPGNREMDYMTELLLYASSRAQLVAEVIRPAIESGRTVLCDRFVDSNLAYQGFGRGIPIELIQKLNEPVTCGIEPDITFFFDLDPEIALTRLSGHTDRLESEQPEFHRRVYEGYITLCSKYPDRIFRIRCDGGIGEIFERVRVILEKQMDYGLMNDFI